MNTIEQCNEQIYLADVFQTGGELANQQASMALFSIYRSEKSPNTQAAQRRALKRFGGFLTSHYDERFTAHEGAHALYLDPSSWTCVTWGYVTAYRQKLLSDGLPVSTLNQHLSVIRTYAAMAFQAGYLSSDEERRISKVKGVKGRKVVANLNAGRKQVDARKSINTLSKKQVRTLERSLMKVDTPTGTRDLLLFECLFRHGMRASEVLLLTAGSFDLDARQITFERPKVGEIGRHDLEPKTIERFKAYLSEIGDDDPFWQSSKRGGHLSGKPLTRSSLDRAVKKWGQRIGIEKLSAHDGRHSIATIWANKNGMTPQRLLDFFGWASILTAQRYIERQEVGNRGMKNAF